ncbi:hypothetical protein SGPA1_30035 [Streptomyces misionensis JCM 4497]
MCAPGAALGPRTALAGCPLHGAHRSRAPRTAPPTGPRHVVRQQAVPHRLPARARHPLPRRPVPLRGLRLHRAGAGRRPAYRAGAGPGVRVACAPVGRAAVALPRPGTHRQLEGAHAGVHAGVRHPARRRPEGAGAGGPRQVPGARGADVRARTGVARRAVPARVVDAHPGTPRALRRRRLGAEPGRARPAAGPADPGVPGAARPAPDTGPGRPPGPAAAAVRPHPRRGAGLVGGPPAARPDPVPDQPHPGAAARAGRGTAPPGARHAPDAAAARAVRQGRRGGPPGAGRALGVAERRPGAGARDGRPGARGRGPLDGRAARRPGRARRGHLGPAADRALRGRRGAGGYGARPRGRRPAAPSRGTERAVRRPAGAAVRDALRRAGAARGDGRPGRHPGAAQPAAAPAALSRPPLPHREPLRRELLGLQRGREEKHRVCPYRRWSRLHRKHRGVRLPGRGHHSGDPRQPRARPRRVHRRADLLRG